MRKLASIRRVADIQPIEGADAIEVATVDGWRVVIKKGEFRVGDLAVYFEVDSFVPHELAPFLTKGDAEPREYEGVRGERLRTVRLRGQISQGLLLPVGERDYVHYITKGNGEILTVHEGMDVTEFLGILKWEPPIAPNLVGQVRGVFPTHLIPKTDQERIQNCFDEIAEKGGTYEVSLKLDGTSVTIFRWEGELRVCSRNLELKINEENKENTLIKMAMAVGDRIPHNYAVQGELCGPGIQGNREGFKEHRFFVFDVYDIFRGEYLSPAERRARVAEWGMEHVPVLGEEWMAPTSVDEGLGLAEVPSINHPVAEGLVWKSNPDVRFSFKTISNKFLLREKN